MFEWRLLPKIVIGVALVVAAGTIFWVGRLSAQGLAPAEAQSALLVATIASVTTILVSVLNAWMTSQTASGRFLAEKWWLKKDEAYEQVIENLAILKHAYDERWAHAAHEKSLTLESQRRLDSEAQKAREYLARTAARGGYPLSDPAISALNELMRDLDKEEREDWQLNFDLWGSAAKRCGEAIVQAAKNELGQHRS